MENVMIPELVRLKPIEVTDSAPFRFRFKLEPPEAAAPHAEVTATGKTGTVLSPDVFAIARGTHQVLKPISMHDTPTGPVIIDGHRRMQFAYQAGIAQIPAFIYSADTPRRSICELAISSALESRDLSGVECTLAAYKIACFLARSHCAQSLPLDRIEIADIPVELLPPLGALFKRPVSERFLLHCFEILQLSIEELDMLNSLGMQVEHIIPLLELTTQERLWLLNRKQHSAMSTAEMRKLGRLLTFARSKKGFHLGDWDRQVPHAPGKPLTGTALIGLLKQEIYPELSRRERNISNYVKNMELPSTIKIKAPENLEGDSFSCYFTFSSSSEFRRYMNILRWAGGDGKIKKIVDELNSSSGSKE